MTGEMDRLTDCVGPYNHLSVVFTNTQVLIALFFKQVGETLSVSQHLDGFDGTEHFRGEVDAVLRCFLIDGLAFDEYLSDKPAQHNRDYTL